MTKIASAVSNSTTSNSPASATSKFYRQFIIEASKSKKYRGEIKDSQKFSGSNPSCGDELMLYLLIDSPKTTASASAKNPNVRSSDASAKILDAHFDGHGCAISMASAHFLCENLIGKTVAEAEKYIEKYLKSLDSGIPDASYVPFSNFALLPARVNCARLAWRIVKFST